MTVALDPHIERILAAGNSAPSGENCQPWRFVVRGKEVEVRLVPGRDQSVYAWGQRASYLACGAVIENMAIAATAEHMRAEIEILPDAHDAELVARVRFFSDQNIAADPLVGAIPKRVTNRKPYTHEPLSSPDREALLNAGNYGGISLKLIEDTRDMRVLGRVGSTNEEIMLANPVLHHFFFSHINWTQKEDKERKIGFYIKTLELPPPVQVLFKALRHWRIMRVLVSLRFNRAVAAQNGATNAAASAIGALIVPDITPTDFIRAGQSIERIWLATTAHQLSLQPLSGIFFFHLAVTAGDDNFSQTERCRITKAYEIAEDMYKARGQRIAFMFRIGKGEVPSAQATRFPLTEVVQVIS